MKVFGMGLEQNKKTSMWENVMTSPIAVDSNLKKNHQLEKRYVFCRGADESSREAGSGVSSLVSCLACPTQCNDEVFTRAVPWGDMNGCCLRCPVQIYIRLQTA